MMLKCLENSSSAKFCTCKVSDPVQSHSRSFLLNLQVENLEDTFHLVLKMLITNIPSKRRQALEAVAREVVGSNREAVLASPFATSCQHQSQLTFRTRAAAFDKVGTFAGTATDRGANAFVVSRYSQESNSSIVAALFADGLSLQFGQGRQAVVQDEIPFPSGWVGRFEIDKCKLSSSDLFLWRYLWDDGEIPFRHDCQHL